MIIEDKMQEEIDKAAEALMKVDLIQNYAMLLRIKYSSNREKDLDNELKTMEVKMKYMGED